MLESTRTSLRNPSPSPLVNTTFRQQITLQQLQHPTEMVGWVLSLLPTTLRSLLKNHKRLLKSHNQNQTQSSVHLPGVVQMTKQGTRQCRAVLVGKIFHFMLV